MGPSNDEQSPHFTSRRGPIVGGQANATLQKVHDIDLPSYHQQKRGDQHKTLPCPSQQRKSQSLSETPFDPETFADEADDKDFGRPDTVLYLAYGSNLCAETFQGKRGIKPLAQVNVLVPELVMTFDLPGIPYVEPCFANTRYRNKPSSLQSSTTDSEKHPVLNTESWLKYHKDRWKKGLVGVVYEVTKKDYAHIIATEGGGASYRDIVVDCYALSAAETVPEKPTATPFKAHTLFSPAIPSTPPGQPPPKSGGRITRPDPSYAQASARYLKLITDGADEHDLPKEYKQYLHELQPYTMTTNKQRLGQFIFIALWVPIISFVFSAQKLFVGKGGRSPAWLVELMGAIFKAVWASYDGFFVKLFGDGERTIDKDEDEDEVDQRYSETKNSSPSYGAMLKKEAVEVV
ncbi:MAG: hypothetical protein M1830_000980 [Pleopsidium flavum]|nr:MAG: hypothetical protein M1830_000980 [Pleopsidium flavum]